MADWLTQNWFDLISVIGILGSLLYTAASFRMEIKARRISVFLTLTHHHQRIWQDFYHNPELLRVIDENANVKLQRVKHDEREFVNLIVQHLHSVYLATREGLLPKPDNLCQEIADFFSLPIPAAVWEYIKVVQDDNFASFVDSCLEEKQ